MFISSNYCPHIQLLKDNDIINLDFLKKLNLIEVLRNNNIFEEDEFTENENEKFFNELIYKEDKKVKDPKIPYICLSCGKIINEIKDINLHKNELGHIIYINLCDISLWCFECNNPFNFSIKGCPIKLNNETINKIKFQLEFLSEKVLNYHSERFVSKDEIFDIKYKNLIKKFKNNEFKNVIIMVGAGISTTAGIPDFRSKTGLFKQLQDKYYLNSPEEFFYKSTFLAHPEYIYEFFKIFDLSKTKPTLTHKFINYLIQKKNVKYLFTQNIDDLELKAKIPKEKIIFAHGTFSEGHCTLCGKNIDINIINEGIQKQEIVHCDVCNGPCKPKIVFYGENLSEDFYLKANESKDSDLVIIMGTSLQVYPFAAIPKLLKPSAWKLVFNYDKVGSYKYDFLTKNSIFIQGKTDETILEFLNDVNLKDDFFSFLKSFYNDDINVIQNKNIEMISVNNTN